MQQNTIVHKYWYWDKGLSDDLCDKAISEIQESKLQKGEIFGHDGESEKVDLKIRDSNIIFPDQNHWLEGILFNHAVYANMNANWNYFIERAEGLQLTEYGEQGHYDWHEDWNPYVEKGALIRKLSVVCLLSDQSEFEGGEFQVKGGTNIPLKKGSIIVFPSYVTHRVAPVLSGRRMSAVTWILGRNTL